MRSEPKAWDVSQPGSGPPWWLTTGTRGQGVREVGATQGEILGGRAVLFGPDSAGRGAWAAFSRALPPGRLTARGGDRPSERCSLPRGQGVVLTTSEQVLAVVTLGCHLLCPLVFCGDEERAATLRAHSRQNPLWAQARKGMEPVAKGQSRLTPYFMGPRRVPA